MSSARPLYLWNPSSVRGGSAARPAPSTGWRRQLHLAHGLNKSVVVQRRGETRIDRLVPDARWHWDHGGEGAGCKARDVGVHGISQFDESELFIMRTCGTRCRTGPLSCGPYRVTDMSRRCEKRVEFERLGEEGRERE
eukprot:6199402-Pleurochrysis_carterae.AAC.3